MWRNRFTDVVTAHPTEVDIVSISPTDIRQTYTFDRPICTSSGLSPTSSPKSSLKCKLHSMRRKSGSSFGKLSSSYSSSSDSETESTTSSWGSSEQSYSPHEFTPQQTRNALIFARTQLLNSSEFRKTGGNVLFFEGWSVTKFRKGHHTRIQVVYTGRPAVARYYHSSLSASTPTMSPPPFMDVLGDGW
ncbi:hypothetical protein FRC03_006506 [Tulasnella sp. 419]|nr:hypothetical protein FRC03_006506 [Tulasnella sp. 419]